MNPTSERLKQLAHQVPFLMEKENYLQAAAEIDRLHMLIEQIDACVKHSSDQALVQIAHILQEATS